MKKIATLFTLLMLISSVLFATPEFAINKVSLEKIDKEYGIFTLQRVYTLVQIMNNIKDLDEKEKLEKVNDFFNQIPYASDKETYGISDYWATRLEFIAKNRGDCEDFVIAKYFTLTELGVSPSKLFMTYAKSLQYKTAHLVLTYYETPQSIPLVLDNYNNKILPASEREDLIHVYSFNGDELFNAKYAQIGKIVPAVTRQTRPWDELLITYPKDEQFQASYTHPLPLLN